MAATLNQLAPLFPGKRNFWQLAVSDASLAARLQGAMNGNQRAQLAQETFEKFLWHHVIPHLEDGSVSNVVGFELARAPLAGNVKSQAPVPQDPDWIFVGGEFEYSGAQTAMPWPWQTGLLSSSPENLVEGLWNVFMPAPLPHPEPGVLDTIENTAADIGQDVKKVVKGIGNGLTWLVIGGAVLVLLLGNNNKR